MKDSRRNRANVAAKAEKRARFMAEVKRPPENKYLPEDYKTRLAEHFKGDA